MGDDIALAVTPTDDNRSYHISSEKIRQQVGFVAKKTIRDAVIDLKHAFDCGKLPNSLTDKKYFNIRLMQSIDLT
jgi:hypothetical protein